MTRDQALLLAYIAAKHPDLETKPARDTGKARKTDLGHTLAGMAAAKNAQLNHGLGGIEHPPM